MRLIRLVVLFLGVLLCALNAAEGKRVNWQQRVTLTLDGQGIGEAVSQIIQQTGVRIVPMRDLAAGGINVWQQPYHLSVRNMPLSQAAEWLARLCGGSYHLLEGKVIISRGYSWIDRHSFGLVLRNVETLIGPERDIDGFERFINELTKVVSLLDSGYYVRLEQKGEQVKLVANFPVSLKPVIDKALASLESSGDTPGKAVPPIMSAAQRELISSLYKPVLAAYRQQPLWDIIDDLSRQSGVNIGYDQPRAREKPVTLDLGQVSLREALHKLAEQAGFKSVEMSEPDGVWLSDYPGNWNSMRSSQSLWADNAVVKCYNLKRLALESEGDVVAHEIRKGVSPRSWFDPLACVLFHKSSGNLLVIADAQAIEKVEYFLATRKPSADK